MSTFLEQLAVLNEQNFLGGVANYGAAVKEKKQNESLVELYNKFKADKNELQTTMEQTGDFNKFLGTTDTERKAGEVPKDVLAAVDFMQIANQMGAYTNLYQPFISAFVTLGDDGVKVANTLSTELAQQLQVVEQKGIAPLRNIEYKALATDYYWTRDKFDSWIKDEALRRDSMEATDYILNSPTFDLIEGGDITTASGERLKKHNIAIKTVVDNAFEHFGGKISKGAITAGLKLAMDNSGKSFKFNDLALLSKEAGQGITDMELEAYMSKLRGLSSGLMNMNDRLKGAWRNYVSKGTLPSKEEFEAGLAPDPELVKDMAKIYGPGGTYMNYYALVSGMMPGVFGTTTKRPIDKNDPDSQLMNLPVEGLEDIYMPVGDYGIVKGDYHYNPYDRIALNKKLKEEKNKITSGSLWENAYSSDKPYITSEEFKLLTAPKVLPENAFLRK